MSSLPASIKRIRSRATEKRWRHCFPHYKSMRAFCCHGNQSFDPICPKTLCNLSPTPVMLHIKFDQDWPTGFRDIKVWKCGRRWTTTDGGPLVYYKLTLWAFGSGELIKADPPGYLWSKYECFLMSGWYSTWVALTLNFEVIPRTGRNYEQMNIQMERRNLYTPRHKCRGL